MPTAVYVHYDVFTTRPFAGNQLAMFPDARGLSTTDMQALANEMNFAESAFVFPPETSGTHARLRIFTPGREMPMAGHPVIGSTFALADAGVIAAGRAQWVFGLNVGPTPVALEWRGDAVTHAWMDQGRPEFRPLLVPEEAVVAAIGADGVAWTATGLPVAEGSCGAAFFYVPLTTRAAVDACRPDDGALRALTSAFGGAHIGVFVFSTEPGDDGATVYSRMFAPEAGVVEDPATGSATGPLAAYLVRHGVVPLAARHAMVSMQGVKMGRPSQVHARVEASAADAVTGVHVGGSAVRVGEGLVRW